MVNDLLGWWNLLFSVPLGLALGFTLVTVLTGFGADHEMDHDGDFEAHAEVDHGLEHVDGHEVHHHESESDWAKALTFLGLGRVPLTTLLVTFAVLWGVTGLISNACLENVLRSPLFFAPISVGLALVVALFGTRWTARFFGKWLPTVETYSIRRADLVDCEGVVQYPVSSNSGLVNVEFGGYRYEVFCRVPTGNPSLERGTKVILLSYLEDQDLFYVGASSLGEQRTNIGKSKTSA